MTKNKWYNPGKSSGWKKSYPAAKRRKIELKSKGGDYLKAARAKMSLSNVTTDKETKEKARADALYFYKKHKELGGKS